MLKHISQFKKKFTLQKSAIFSFILSLLIVTGAFADPMTKNEVEDLKIIISQVVGGEPNVLFIKDWARVIRSSNSIISSHAYRAREL